MEEHICKKEGISVNLQEAEDTCPYCGGEFISVNDIQTDDWLEIIENIKNER